MFPQNLSRIVRMTLVAAAVSAGLLGANAWAGPADVGGLVLWLEADAARLTKDANNLVSTWADVTDTANNATPDNVAQSDPARRPGWVDKAIGGRPALKFDSGDFLNNTSGNLVASGGARTVFVVGCLDDLHPRFRSSKNRTNSSKPRTKPTATVSSPRGNWAGATISCENNLSSVVPRRLVFGT